MTTSNPDTVRAQLLGDTLRRAVELHQQGYWQHAGALYEAALTLAPEDPDALQLYGVLNAQAGDCARAIELMERSLALRPGQLSVLTNLGNALRQSGAATRALGCYDAALAIAPGDVVTLIERSRALVDLDRFQEAVASADAALAVDASNADAFNQRGWVLVQMHRFEDGQESFRRALKLNPEHVDALLNAAISAHEGGLSDEAVRLSERALALAPDRLQARIGMLRCLLPAVAGDEAQQARSVVAYAAELDRFTTWLDTHPQADPNASIGATPTFYLAYRETSNARLLSAFGSAWSRYLQHWQAAAGVVLRARARTPAGRPRVGIVSAHVREHSVYDVITRTLFAALERAGCETHLYTLSAESDQETTYAAARADYFERGPKSLAQWATAIAGAQCDLLVYPEIGMDELTLKLAGMRLAPAQAASWGHPETTGLPTIDYFLSGAAFEPPQADANYTERLVRLAHLGCYLPPAALLPPGSQRGAVHLPSLGLDPGLPLFVCPGTPYKYLPSHDALLARIAEQVGPCQFVFFEVRQRPELSRLTYERLARAFEARGLDWTRYLRLAPWLPKAAFRSLCASATAVLDTVGFSGFNTALHALESGAPVVAWEGERLRGRLASGTLRHLGLADLVADSHAGYATVAARLAGDAAYATGQRERIAAARARAYQDEAALEDLVTFIRSAVRDGRSA